MMTAIKSILTFDSRRAPDRGRSARRTPSPRKLSVYAAAVVVKLREVAPYAALELVLPGGSLMALLLWIYRRQKKAAIFQTHEILSLL